MELQSLIPAVLTSLSRCDEGLFSVFLSPKMTEDRLFSLFSAHLHQEFYNLKNGKTISELNLQSENKLSSLVCKCRWKKSTS